MKKVNYFRYCNMGTTITGDEESWEDMEEEVEIGADGEEQNGTMSIVR